ncbi:MAG: ATP-binding protein [Longilinea sp.]|nr:ATP-binding protein [Longilinea sp.]MCA1954111.1 ATP-binding protein [Anaerolinea sp.]
MDSELSFPNRIQALTQVLDFITERGRELGLDERQLFEVRLAVDEAVTNVVSYAYPKGQEGMVRIRCHVEEGLFAVELLDYGRPFNPLLQAEPDVTCPLDKRTVGGLGIYFIRRVMDEVTYRYDALDGNVLRMVKYLRKVGTD